MILVIFSIIIDKVIFFQPTNQPTRIFHPLYLDFFDVPFVEVAHAIEILIKLIIC
jgi:hypothetical protein